MRRLLLGFVLCCSACSTTIVEREDGVYCKHYIHTEFSGKTYLKVYRCFDDHMTIEYNLFDLR